MSILSYLGPKRFAAYQIAHMVMDDWKNQDGINFRLKALRVKDRRPHELVLEELGKYGLSVSVDS